MSDWQPMETCPRDGTLVDLWVVKWVHPDPSKPDTYRQGRRLIDCKWDDDKPKGYSTGDGGLASNNILSQGSSPSWQTSAGVKIQPREATHWMPVPSDPFAA